jgi:dipeptidyl aminopeptidase/acylaminoacyl peptidase
MDENLSTPKPSIPNSTAAIQTPEVLQTTSKAKPNHRRIALIVVIFLFFILGGIAFYLFLGNPASPQNNASRVATALGVPTPTPMPFREMTVPYLRERKYESSLGNLEIVNSNGNYTSYLTSYDSDGLKINALLTKPAGEEPPAGWPAIVFIHGYIPPTLYQTIGPQYTDYVDYLARNGFVVMKIDLRGHGESEGTPGGGYYGSDYIIDALNAYAALQSSPFIDSRAIGMWGHSMSGNILMRSMAAKTDIPAIVIWAGAVYSYEDQRKYGIDDNSYRPPMNDTARQQKRRELFEKHGSPSAQSVFWQQVAPTNYLSDIKGAIEIHHAVDDDVVNVGYSRDLIALLDKTSVPHELYEYPTGGHNLTGVSFNLAMQRTVDFFKKYLTPAE